MLKSILKASAISMMLLMSLHTRYAESQTANFSKHESVSVKVSVDPVSTEQNLRLIRVNVSESCHLKLIVKERAQRYEQTLIDGDIEAGEYDVLFKTKDVIIKGIYIYLIEVSDDNGIVIYSEEKDM